MEHIAAPDPVEASRRLRNARAIALAKRQPLRVEPAAHERSGGFDPLFFWLDTDHMAAAADGLGQPQAVEPDAAAHVEAARARRQAENIDDPSSPRPRQAEGAPNQPVISVGNVGIAEMSKRARTAVVGKSLQERAFARHLHYALAHSRGYDAETHLQAMDIEGIDVAVIYGTRGRQVLMHDDLDPQVASALARAHNNWTRDFCAIDPGRLKFAAQLAFHEIGRAHV